MIYSFEAYKQGFWPFDDYVVVPPTGAVSPLNFEFLTTFLILNIITII